ncbi:MAG: shikimate dehydrogenase [Acholeplasmataceae bacterium]|nr:shikimate dehydrogenase [Acholeplasmataceae bacterium]
MLKLGLIGYQIGYSKSPVIHQKFSEIFHIPLEYTLIDIKDTTINEYIKALKQGFYHGFNITTPYKETVIEYCDLLTDAARQVGAVNTIYMQEGLVVGDNTDVEGFSLMLQKNHIDLKNKKVHILGSGGAAKACYYVLKKMGSYPLYVSRSPGVSSKTISYDAFYQDQVEIIIQATPVGSYPRTELSPIVTDFVTDKIVIELIYNPAQTKLLKMANKGINGLDMLIYQAFASFKIWAHLSLSLNDTDYQKIKEVLIHE